MKYHTTKTDKEMEHINRVELQGTAGSVRSNAGMTLIPLATSRAFTSREGIPVIETTWHRVVAKGELPFKKGDFLNVKGMIRTSRFISSSGEGQVIHEVFAQEIRRVDE